MAEYFAGCPQTAHKTAGQRAAGRCWRPHRPRENPTRLLWRALSPLSNPPCRPYIRPCTASNRPRGSLRCSLLATC